MGFVELATIENGVRLTAVRGATRVVFTLYGLVGQDRVDRESAELLHRVEQLS